MGMLRFICTLLQLYMISIVALVVMSYAAVPSRHPVGRIVAGLSRLVEPPLRSIRRVVPGFPIGSVRLDFSPMILLFGVYLLSRVICR